MKSILKEYIQHIFDNKNVFELFIESFIKLLTGIYIINYNKFNIQKKQINYELLYYYKLYDY